MDLYSALSPVLLLEQLRNSYHKKKWFIGPLEVFRNVLILMPILFTWYALSEASSAYHLALRTDPNLAGVPFLFQWEQGFNGALPSAFSFSQVAIIDVIILAIIVMATFFVHYFDNIHFENSDRKALQLVADFNSLLCNVSKILVQESSAEALSQTLLNDIKIFVDILQQEGDEIHDFERQFLFFHLLIAYFRQCLSYG